MASNKKTVLLVDDEKRLLSSMAQRISLLGFTPLKATSGMAAIELAQKNPIDLAIVDLMMPDMEGLVTITKLKEIIPDLKTVLLTGYGNEKVKQATEALGSLYVEKDSMDRLWEMIKKSGSEGRTVVIQTQPGKDDFQISSSPASFPAGRSDHPDSAPYENTGPASKENRLPRIIGETFGMQGLRKNISRFSELDCTVIIKGETGTGKELAARTIHRLSGRSHQRFLAFDCGCFSNDFRFNELVAYFGGTDTKGPGTGSQGPDRKSPGFNGTIFLDHIENMPDQNQEEMVHIMNTRSTPGTRGPKSDLMDVRFIVATQQQLSEKVKQKKFRQDLYQRIRTIELEIPPLRERREDIPVLCRSFLAQFNREFQKQVTSISPQVFDIFETYAFPGNVRELRHIMERAVILSDDAAIVPGHLPHRLKVKETVASREPETGPKKFPTLNEMEQKHILRALEVTKGNKSKASELLGISRAALWRKLRIISSGS